MAILGIDLSNSNGDTISRVEINAPIPDEALSTYMADIATQQGRPDTVQQPVLDDDGNPTGETQTVTNPESPAKFIAKRIADQLGHHYTQRQIIKDANAAKASHEADRKAIKDGTVVDEVV